MFGMHCAFTYGVVAACAAAGVAPLALLVAGPPGISAPIERVPEKATLPIIDQARPMPNVRTFWIDDPGSGSTTQLITSLRPDVIAVACFRRRIPMATVRIARFGGLNVHPSPLPVGRGPDPLFWTLRRGDGSAAVTVHALARELDAGAIYAQQTIAYQAGIREAELDTRLASAGGVLLAETIMQVMSGTAVPITQNDDRATYEPPPSSADYVISTTEPVERAYTFIRGIAERGYPITIRTSYGSEDVRDALAYHLATGSDSVNSPDGDWIQFANGRLQVLRWR